MANAIHQWIDAVTTRIEDQRRTLDKLDSELSATKDQTADLRETVASIKAQVETCDRMVQAQIEALKDQLNDQRRHTNKLLTGAIGAIGTLASAVHYFMGN